MSAETKVMAYRAPDGTWYQLQNLPWLAVAEIEAAHNTSWVFVVDMPQTNGSVALAVVRAVHQELGIDPPVVETAHDLATYVQRFGLVDPTTGAPIVDEAPIAWSAPTT